MALVMLTFLMGDTKNVEQAKMALGDFSFGLFRFTACSVCFSAEPAFRLYLVLCFSQELLGFLSYVPFPVG